jgi:hypothetical protein
MAVLTKTFKCADCGETKPTQRAGYGIYDGDKAICYACCGLRNAAKMRETGKAILYLTDDQGRYKVTNWPGTLSIEPWRVRSRRHNLVGRRTDVWFNFGGASWHGVTYGEDTQLCHCKRLKG